MNAAAALDRTDLRLLALLQRAGRASNADLAAQVLNDLVRRTGADPALIEDVIMGCVTQAGQQEVNSGSCPPRSRWPSSSSLSSSTVKSAPSEVS